MSMKRIIIHVSDAKTSNDPTDILTTYSLGSCIGVCLYDPQTNAGGMLHYQLPDSKIDPDRAQKQPFMFADTGMNILVDKLKSIGANIKRMQIKIAGAAMETGPQGFDIGKRNHLALRKILWNFSAVCLNALRVLIHLFGGLGKNTQSRNPLLCFQSVYMKVMNYER